MSTQIFFADEEGTNYAYKVRRDGEYVIITRQIDGHDYVGDVALPAPLLNDITRAVIFFGHDALTQFEERTRLEAKERELAKRLRNVEHALRIELDLPQLSVEPIVGGAA